CEWSLYSAHNDRHPTDHHHHCHERRRFLEIGNSNGNHAAADHGDGVAHRCQPDRESNAAVHCDCEQRREYGGHMTASSQRHGAPHFSRAPATIAPQQTVTVTAKSQADNATIGTAAVTLSPAYPNGYTYRRPIVIDHTKVKNTDQTNFPVLISGTYSYLATLANGGKVQSASGYDIIFSSDCNGSQKLDHEIETYRATDGTVSM